MVGLSREQGKRKVEGGCLCNGRLSKSPCGPFVWFLSRAESGARILGEGWKVEWRRRWRWRRRAGRLTGWQAGRLAGSQAGRWEGRREGGRVGWASEPVLGDQCSVLSGRRSVGGRPSLTVAVALAVRMRVEGWKNQGRLKTGALKRREGRAGQLWNRPEWARGFIIHLVLCPGDADADREPWPWPRPCNVLVWIWRYASATSALRNAEIRIQSQFVCVLGVRRFPPLGRGATALSACHHTRPPCGSLIETGAERALGSSGWCSARRDMQRGGNCRIGLPRALLERSCRRRKKKG